MVAVVSLSKDLVQILRTTLECSIQGQSKQITDLLESFRKNDLKYSTAFLKHIPDADTSLRSKYEMVCDLRKTAMEEHQTEIMRIINTQREAMRECVAMINDINVATVDSTDFDSVSLPIKLEPEEDQIGIPAQEQSVQVIENVSHHQKEGVHRSIDGRKRKRSEMHTDYVRASSQKYQSKRRRVDAVVEDRDCRDRNDRSVMESHRAELRQLAEHYSSIKLRRIETVFHTHCHRSIRDTFNGKIKLLISHFPELFRMKYSAKSNQWTVISRLYPNVSGYWRYRSDTHYQMVLEDDPVTGQVLGFMIFNNKKQFPIEGNRDRKKEKGSYQFDKIHHDGERVHYSVFLGPENTMSITNDRTSRTKTAILESKDIPQQFQEEFENMKGVSAKIAPGRQLKSPSFHEKLMEANMTGLWRESERVHYILFEDFTNGNVIGFMQRDGVTKSTITGSKRPGGKSHLIERIHETQQHVEYEVTLFPNQQRIEMIKADDHIRRTPRMVHLQLLRKRLPKPLFYEMERLKRIENYEGRRFLQL